MQEFTYPYKYPKNYKGSGVPTTLSTIDEVPKTFTPIEINNLILKNRIVVSPMCQYSCKNNSGLMNDWHLIHYSNFAKGGAALIIFESTAVQQEGRISYADAGVWDDCHIPSMRKIIDSIHSFDTCVGIQLSHAGRKASTQPPFLENSRQSIPENDPSGNGWKVVGPSPIRYNDNMSMPREMSVEDIHNTIQAFKDAAIRSLKAGFDFIEIHAAHGYLINQFLSPTSNKRTDQYGGNFVNRIRILLEIIESVRSVWPRNKALGVRLSCEEWTNDGWNMEDTIHLVEILNQLGTIDLIDCSSGGNSSNQKINVSPMYQTPFANSIKSIINTPLRTSGGSSSSSSSTESGDSRTKNQIKVSTVGLITSGNEIESILQDGKADIVMVGRQFLRNPFSVYQFANDLNVKIDYQLQYYLAQRK
ncbi:hypothetical protein RB653_008250 [Dictyostelium firmibasis]|uniref:NADH:flavin oxidoreductase/NADH oxidase N-terminal domain-containing protein n=1 Tax=Dictyostelium firmibasis TaxID=79012 RepID=A0AAN7TZF4_9MYCE